MRRVLIAALATAAIAATTSSAHASLMLVGTFSGNQCGGAGGFPVCYASGTTAGSGDILKTAGGSPSIIRIGNSDDDKSDTGGFASISGNELVISFNSTTHILTYTYTPTGADPVAHYLGLYQGGDGVGAATDVKNPYLLFYDPTGITTGTIDLGSYYKNDDNWSHVDLFDTGTAPVPEPATWALMLLGFGGMGMALRRSRRRDKQALMQIA